MDSQRFLSLAPILDGWQQLGVCSVLCCPCVECFLCKVPQAETFPQDKCMARQPWLSDQQLLVILPHMPTTGKIGSHCVQEVTL